MKTPNEIIEILSQFSGTENYYQHQFGIYYTDGIMEMATICQAFWLVDVVASYQFEPKISEEHFQVFGLKVNEDKSAIVEISDGNDNILMTQNLEFTDFPLPEIELWFSQKVCYLPSEH